MASYPGRDLYSAGAFKNNPAGALNPEDFNFFQQSRRRVNQSYGLGKVQNQFQRDTATLGHNNQVADLKRRFATSQEELLGQLAAGGVMQDQRLRPQGAYTNTQRQNTWKRGVQRGERPYNVGVSGSGARRLGQFGETVTEALADLKEQWLNTISGYDLSDLQLGEQKASAMDDIVSQEAARKAAASIIRGN